MSLLVRDGVSTEQLSSRDGRRQRARSKIEKRSSMFGATWELAVLQAVLCAAQQPRVARAHAFASSRLAKTPGGATALIACLGPEKIHDLGYRYVLYPVLLGAVTLLAVALVTNNLDPRRRYPLWWY